MASTVRVDSKGRLTIPPKIREELNINPGDTFHFEKDGQKIQLVKKENPFDVLGRQAIKEHREGKTIRLEDLAKKWDIDLNK